MRGKLSGREGDDFSGRCRKNDGIIIRMAKARRKETHVSDITAAAISSALIVDLARLAVCAGQLHDAEECMP